MTDDADHTQPPTNADHKHGTDEKNNESPPDHTQPPTDHPKRPTDHPKRPTDYSGPIGRRRQAAVAGHLGQAGQARRGLDDPDPGVRATALRALDRAGGLKAGELAAALSDHVPSVRVAALEVATGRADVSVEAVAALLNDSDCTVVEAAAWSCGEKAPAEQHNQAHDSTGDNQTHTDQAHDSAGDNQTHTDQAHDSTGDNQAHDSGGPAGRSRSWGHDDLGHDGVVAKLSRLATTHNDALCRESAIAALGAIGDPGGLGAILSGLDDKPAVRRRAVIALAHFDGPEVEAALDRAEHDRDRQVRAAAAELRTASA